MKKDKEKEIDNIFKKGLEEPDGNHGHMENDWEAMDKMLDKRRKSPFIIYWLPILSSVAALLLLLIGWWLLKPVVPTRQQNQQEVVVKHDGKQNIANNNTHVTPDTLKPGFVKTKDVAKNKPTSIQNTLSPNTLRIQNFASTAKNHGTEIGNAINKKEINANPIINQQNNNVLAANNNTGHTNKPNTTQGNDSVKAVTSVAGTSQIANNTAKINDAGSSATGSVQAINNSKKSKVRSSFAYRPQFAISVLASTDKNGVNSFQQTKAGNNAGILFSVGLTRKLTISTGAIYTAKQYMTDFASYHTSYQFPTNPVSVLADCKMFDIPFNIDYNVYNKHRNKISVGTGISSYLMLNENYQFNYAAYTTGPAKYNVPSPDKYLLSIVNIQATYERQINSKFGLTVQPYLKLPLSAVGASEVHLQTTGVAVGFTWNLNSLSKP